MDSPRLALPLGSALNGYRIKIDLKGSSAKKINFASNHIFWVELGWDVLHLAQRGPKAKLEVQVGAREGRVKSRVCKSGRANHLRMVRLHLHSDCLKLSLV